MLRLWHHQDGAGWDAVVTRHATDGGLLQSWAWGRFQEKLGNAVYNVSDEKGEWLAQCLQLKAGNQWILVVPRGPISTAGVTAESFCAFMKHLQAFAKERGCFMVRLDPAWDAKEAAVMTQAGARKAKRERNPKQTLTLDLAPSEEELMSAMKSKWRYNIRLAEKKGVSVRLSYEPADAKLFWQLVEKTTDRQGFASYDEQYFRVLMETLGPSKQAAFAIAEMDGKPIAALLLGFCGHTAYYLHGASDYEHRNVMAPHLLQWRSMLEAKQRGLATYDFWGVSEQEWPGVTRFKQGFAPEKAFAIYVGTYEMSVKRGVYWAYRLRQMISR